jgi:hypothetical protein
MTGVQVTVLCSCWNKYSCFLWLLGDFVFLLPVFHKYLEPNRCLCIEHKFWYVNDLMFVIVLLYLLTHKNALFLSEKCDLNSTCVLFAEGKCYFQTYKYPYSHQVKTTMKMILVAVTTIFWVSVLNKLYYGC